MHSPSALTEHVSLNLAGFFLLNPVHSNRHLKEEDSDEDEERDEEDRPLAELQEGLAAEEPHYSRSVCQLDGSSGQRPTD